MPRRITKEEAIAAIARERTDDGCLVCAILGGRAGDHHVVHEDDAIVVSLPRYVSRWGHMMIAPRAHFVRVADVPRATWLSMSGAAQDAARVIETLHAPHRVYVLSTGTRAEGLQHTCEHVHVHVLPIYEPSDRPRDVITWQNGVLVAEADEWHALRDRARAVYRDG